MRHSRTIISLALASLGFVASAQGAAVIGIDFAVGTATPQSPAVTDAVGPYVSAGWYNNVDPSTGPGPGSVSLKDSTGNSTTATFGFTQGDKTLSGNPIYNSSYGAAGTGNGTLTPDQQLYNGVVVSSPTGWSQQVVLQNIPYAVFDVYLLVNAPRVAGDTPDIIGSIQNFSGGVAGGAGTTFYFQNSNQVNAQIPPALGYVQAMGTTLGTATSGANYVLFSGLTNPNQTFDILNVTAANQPYLNNITLGAVEIVDASSVPEPTSLGLLGLASLGLAARRRHA
jgi:hypothetical protein